jgi:hypothetical protein
VVRPPAACLCLCYERQVPNALNATVDAPSPYTSTFQTLVPTGPFVPDAAVHDSVRELVAASHNRGARGTRDVGDVRDERDAIDVRDGGREGT